MKSVKMTEHDYFDKIKGYIDSLASFEDNPNLVTLAPIVEFILKAMIEDCYKYGSHYSHDFIKMQEVEKQIGTKVKYSIKKQRDQVSYDELFDFSDLINLWRKESNGLFLWSKIHKVDYCPLFLRQIPFDEFRQLRNDAIHDNSRIDKISSCKYYYIFLEVFITVIPLHIKLLYPSIYDSYNEYFSIKFNDKKDKEVKLANFGEKLDRIIAVHGQQQEIQKPKTSGSDKVAKPLNKADFIAFIDNLELGRELDLCEVEKFYPVITKTILPFSLSPKKPKAHHKENIQQIEFKEASKNESCSNNKELPHESDVNIDTNNGDTYLSDAISWIKNITEAGTIAVDNFMKDLKGYAEGGNAHWQNIYGSLHFYGDLFSKDLDEAFKSFEAAAYQGYAPAQLNLGIMYLNGFKVKKNLMLAAKHFKDAADNGLLEAIEVLGVMHYYGEGVENSPALAENWFKNAAGMGSGRAQESLGVIYYKKSNYLESVKYFKMAAKNNITSAQNLLAVIYCRGNVIPDYNAAEKMFLKAIKGNSVNAYINLGIMYFNCSQFNKDVKAIEKMQKEIAKNNVHAQFCLGVMFYKNSDFKNAIKWLEMAAGKDARALYNLGTMYFNGEGYDKSVDDALKNFNKAAIDHSLKEAQLSLGFIFYNGIKVRRNYEKALEYFNCAANQGSPLADKILARMYLNGIGTDIDYEQFYQQCRSAYIHGEHDVIEYAQMFI